MGSELLANCPLCNAKYKPREARILDEEMGKHLLHLECRECGNAVLALFRVNAEGLCSVGMVTDLTAEDALRFKDAPGISADDVIGLHELLKEDKFFIERIKNR